MILHNKFQANLPERICSVSVLLYDCIRILWCPGLRSILLNIHSRACNLFAQLGARGASVMFSSGDGGVGAG